MMPRHLPVVVFMGCVLFSVLHAWALHNSERTGEDLEPTDKATVPHSSTEEKKTQASEPQAAGPRSNDKSIALAASHQEKTVPAAAAHQPKGTGATHAATAPQPSGTGAIQLASATQPIVSAVWDRKLLMVKDPANPAKVDPGLSGRIYLFDGSGTASVEADGVLKIALRDSTGNAEPLEWQVDAATLKSFEDHDQHGACYVLYLPIAAYRPAIKEVTLTVSYRTAGGLESPAGESRLTLDDSAVRKPDSAEPPRLH